jgi:hypothetical protein
MVPFLLNKKDNFINKCFMYNSKYILLIVLTYFILSALFSSYCTIQETNNYNEILDVEEDYGTYTYEISGLSDKTLKMAEMDDNTKTYLSIKVDEVDMENDVFDIMCVSEDFFKYSNYSIIEGHFPTDVSEVLVSKCYLFNLGISQDKMIGSTIDVINPNTNKSEKKTVSGLVTLNSNNLLSNQNSNFIIYNINYVDLTDATNTIYIEASNLEDYSSKLENLLNLIYKEDEVEPDYEINYALLNICGYTDEGKTTLNNQRLLYLVIMCCSIFFILIILNNILTVCFEKWKIILNTFKIIGADMKQIQRHIIEIFLGAMLVSSIGGFICGTIGVNIYYACNKMILKLPYNWIIIELILNLIFLLVLVRYKYKRYIICTAKSIVTGQKVKISKSTKWKSIFEKNRFSIPKLSLRNFFVFNNKKLLSIISICSCLIVVYLINLQFQNKKVSIDNNDSFEYYFEVDDYYNVSNSGSEAEINGIKEIFMNLENICNKNNYIMYYENRYETQMLFDKKNLGNDFIDALNQTVSGRINLNNSSDYIELKLTVLGYSNDMIEELLSNSKIEINSINDNEAILLSRSTNKDGYGGKKIISVIGEDYPVDTLVYNDGSEKWETNDYKVVETVDYLPVYPENDFNSICLIINKTNYEHYFNNDFVSSFYLKDIDGVTLSKLQKIVEGNPYITVTNLKDEKAAEKNGYIKRVFLLFIILCMTCFFSLLNIQVQNIFDFDYRKSEFKLLKTIGISNKSIYLIVALETSYVFLLGLISGAFLCVITENILYDMCIISAKYLNVKIILASGSCVLMFMGISIYFTCKKVKRFIKK